MCTPLYKCQHFHSLANICCPACKFISDIPAIIFALFHSWYVSFFRILCHVSEYSWLKCWLLKYRRKKRICKRAESNTRKYLYTCIIVEHLECTRQSRFWQAWTRELGRGWITLSAWVQAVEDFAAGVGGGGAGSSSCVCLKSFLCSPSPHKNFTMTMSPCSTGLHVPWFLVALFQSLNIACSLIVSCALQPIWELYICGASRWRSRQSKDLSPLRSWFRFPLRTHVKRVRQFALPKVVGFLRALQFPTGKVDRVG
jgi:hypothetical protein